MQTKIKITKDPTLNHIRFENLDIGEWFIFTSCLHEESPELFVKIEKSYGKDNVSPVNSFNVNLSKLMYTRQDALVIPIKDIEIIMNNN